MGEKITFLFNRSEITAGTRGASLGPDAIVVAARQKRSDLFRRFQIHEVLDQNFLLDQPTVYPFAKRIDGLAKVYDSTASNLVEIIQAGEFPLVIAADHGSAGGTINGLVNAFPSAKIGVVWIDAHADIHTPYTTPSGNIHGMPLSTALGDDNLECKINELDDATYQLWEQLKSTGGNKQKIKAENLVYIAVRDTEDQENAIMKRLNITNHTVETVRSLGVENVLALTFNQLKDCDVIYVSFDVDSMDPDLTSYGTGTPVKNGLTSEEAALFLEGFAKDKRTACIEFVEVNPCLDEKKNKMAEVALELIERTVNIIENRN
jgi:arginase